MLKGTRSASKTGRLLFYLPIAAIAALVVFGFAFQAPGTGTLVVEAVSSSRFSASTPLAATASVSTYAETTPFNVTLRVSTYTVTYKSVAWYVTPSPKTVTLAGGLTAYAIGVYVPIAKVIAISGGTFNVTKVTAMHGVTPVVWINPSSSTILLHLDSVGQVRILPSENYTHVFQSTGTYNFYLDSNNAASYVVAV